MDRSCPYSLLESKEFILPLINANRITEAEQLTVFLAKHYDVFVYSLIYLKITNPLITKELLQRGSTLSFELHVC